MKYLIVQLMVLDTMKNMDYLVLINLLKKDLNYSQEMVKE